MGLITGIAAIKGITTGLEQVNKLLAVIKDTEHHGQLVQLKEALLDAKEEALALREKNGLLKVKLSNKEKLVFVKDSDAYFKVTNENEKDGPFCKTCWDKDEKLLRLDHDGWCAGCRLGYGNDRRSGNWKPASSVGSVLVNRNQT